MHPRAVQAAAGPRPSLNENAAQEQQTGETKSALLRRLGTRFFVSCGAGDSGNLVRAIDFVRLLSELGLPHRTYFGIGGHNGRFWQAQLPEALRYAFPDYGSPV